MVIQLLLINGIAMGSIYALVALGFILPVNAAGVVNFAQGEFVMFGAFLAVSFAVYMFLPLPVAIIMTIIVMAILGFVFERLCYKPLSAKGAGLIVIIVSTIGVSIFLKNMAQVIWGAVPLNMPAFFNEVTIKLGNISIVPQHLVIIVMTALLLSIQYIFFHGTTLGRMLRASAQDKEAAALVGINVNIMISITFAYSSMLAGLAGALVAPIFFVSIGMGFMAMLKAFIGCAIGGFGSELGAVVGGIIVGLTEILSAYYLSSTYRDVFVFLILIAFLLFKPTGIFGEKIREKV